MRRLIEAMACVVVFVLMAAVVGPALHLDCLFVRRIVLRCVNAALEAEKPHRIRAFGLSRLGLEGGAVSSIEVSIEGVGDFVAHDVRVRASLIRAALALVLRPHAPSFDVQELAIGNLSANLVYPESHPTRPGESTAGGDHGGSLSFSISLESVTVDRAEVRADLRADRGPPLFDPGSGTRKRRLLSVVDAVVDGLAASMALDGRSLRGWVSFHALADGIAPRTADLQLSARGVVPTSLGGPEPDLAVALQAAVASVLVETAGSLHGDLLSVDISVPAATPAQIRSVFPDIGRVGGPVSLDASVQGRLPELAVRSTISLGHGTVGVSGTVFAQEPYRASLAFVGNDLDAQALWQTLPSTSIGFEGHASGTVPDRASLANVDRWDLSCSLDVPSGRVKGLATPAVSARVGLSPGRVLDASLEVGPTRLEVLRPWIDVPTGRGSVRMLATSKGTYPDLLVRAGLRFGTVALDARGSVHLESPYAAHLVLSATRSPGRAVGRHGESQRWRISPVHLHATLDRGRAELLARLSEPGSEVSAHLIRHADGSIGFSVDGRAASLEWLRTSGLLGVPTSGAAALRVDGQVENGRIRTQAVLDLDGVRVREYSLREGRITASLTGALRDPYLSVDLSAIEARYRDLHVPVLVASATGLARAIDLRLSIREPERGETDCLGTVSFEAGRTFLRGLSVRSARHGQVFWAGAQEIAFGDGSLDLTDLLVRGAGDPVFLNARDLLSQKRVAFTLRAPSIDISRVARYLGATSNLSGTASADVELRALAPFSLLRGKVALRRLHAAHVRGLDADLAVDIVSDRGSIEGRIESPNLLRATLTAEPVLSGPLADPESWLLARGAMEIAVEQLGLAAMCRLLSCPSAVKNLVSAAGENAKGRARIERTRRGTQLLPASLLASADVTDSHGRLLSLRARTEFEPERRTFFFSQSGPLDFEMRLEPRPLRELPEPVRPLTVDGIIGAYARTTGTWDRPITTVQIQANALHNVAGQRNVPAFDLDWSASYDGLNAVSTASATSGGRVIARALARARVPIQDWIGTHATRSQWSAVVSATVDRFPLRILPALARHAVDGVASGSVVLSDLHAAPRAEGSVGIDGLRIGRSAPIGLSVRVVADPSTVLIDGKARGPGMRADARLALGCSWRHGAVPHLDPLHAVEITFSSRQLPLALLRPLVGSSFVVGLGGRLDADLHVRGLPSSSRRDLSIRGSLALEDGRGVFVPLGRELRHVRMRVRAEGSNLRLEEFSGATGAGTFHAGGFVRLEGLMPQEVHAEIHVPRGGAIPVTVQGVWYGTAWGDLSLDGALRGRMFDMSARVSTFRLELPPQVTADLQTLDTNPNIEVLQLLGPPEIATVDKHGPIPRTTWSEIDGVALRIQLGDDVAIERDDLRLVLTTPRGPDSPVLTLSSSSGTTLTRFSGSVRVVDGRVAVAGKTFAIEGGLVRFEGADLDNPALDVRAQTDASDGTHVMVQVRGTLQAMKLSLTSSPPKPQSELIALLAFGQARPGAAPGPNTGGGPPMAGPASPGGGGTGAGAAAGVGAGVLTSTVNQLLRRSVLPLRTAIYGGSSTAAGASLAIAERAQIEYVHQFGATQYGQEPASANEVIVDWQFHPSWDLRTLVGDRGTTSIELLWRRWY